MAGFAIVGTLLQLVGLGATSVALVCAWRRRRRTLRDLVFGKKDEPAPHLRWSSASADGPVAVKADAVDVGSTGDRLDRRFDLLIGMTAELRRAQAAADSALEAVDDLGKHTAADLQRLRVELQHYVQDEAADAVPLAAVGVLVTAVGTLLQIPALLGAGWGGVRAG